MKVEFKVYDVIRTTGRVRPTRPGAKEEKIKEARRWLNNFNICLLELADMGVEVKLDLFPEELSKGIDKR